MPPETVTIVNQLTLSAAAIIAVVFLWRRLVSTEDTAKKALENFNSSVLYDLKARIMVCEDKLEIDRQERMKYLPAATEAERKIMLDLDGDSRHEKPRN